MRRHLDSTNRWRCLAAALLLFASCAAGAQDAQSPANGAKVVVLLKTSGGMKRPASLLFRSVLDDRIVKLRERGPEALRSISSGWGEELSVFRFPPGEYVLDRWMADFSDDSGYHTAVSEPLGFHFKVAEGETLIIGRIDLRPKTASKGKLAYTLSHAVLTSDELDRIAYSIRGPGAFISAQPEREGRAALTGTRVQ
jgi:hypothetical protein